MQNHAELLHAKLSASSHTDDLSILREKHLQLETRHMRLQERYDSARKTAHRHNYQYAHSGRQLRSTIHVRFYVHKWFGNCELQTLRTRYAGCVSLDEQAKMHGLIEKMTEERKHLHRQLVTVIV